VFRLKGHLARVPEWLGGWTDAPDLSPTPISRQSEHDTDAFRRMIAGATLSF